MPPEDLDAVASTALGFEALTPAQKDALEAVRSGRDALVVLPTGAGKSAIYQLGSTVRDGATVVVSPLLALQHDQLAAIDASGLGRAEAIDGSTSAAARAAAVRRCATGETAFLFSTPETLLGGDVVDLLAAVGVGLLVVDEAHLLLTWGSSFRPAYAALAEVAERLGGPPVLALTASAGPADREEIARRLRLRDPLVLVGGVRRPNLALAVRPSLDDASAEAAAVDQVRSMPGAALVFVADRQDAERLAASLDGEDRRAVAYHGGLPRRVRDELDDRLRAGEELAVATTNALSLGIDAPAVRQVVHVGRPSTVDAYYQEVGRAGRDGEPAACALFDVVGGAGGRRAREAGAVTLTADALSAVLDAVHGGRRTRAAVQRETSLGVAVVAAAIAELQALGALDPRTRGLAAGSHAPTDDELAERCHRRTLVASARRAGVDQLLASTGCRWQFLEGYFGAPVEPPCGVCDACRAGFTDEGATSVAGGVVEHPEFGRGVVVGLDDGDLAVSFDAAGYRVLDAEVATERGWWRPARRKRTR